MNGYGMDKGIEYQEMKKSILAFGVKGREIVWVEVGVVGGME